MALTLFLLLSAIIIGLSKGGLGGAFAGVLTPVASIFMPVSEAIAYLVPLLVVGDWFALYVYWRQWNSEQLKFLLPPAFVTVLFGTYLLASLPGHTLRIILGILSLAVGTYKLIEPRLIRMRYSYQNWHAYAAGAVSGIGSGLANAGGPPLSAYLLLNKEPAVPFIATSAVFFAAMNAVRTPGLIVTKLLTLSQFLRVVWFMPVVWVGILMGKYIANRISKRQFEHLMTAILIGAGFILILN